MKTNQSVIAIANEFELNLEEERYAYLARPHSEFLRVKQEVENEVVAPVRKESEVSLVECIAIGREYLKFNNDQVLDEFERLHLRIMKRLKDGSETFERNELDLRQDILHSLVQPNLYMQGGM